MGLPELRQLEAARACSVSEASNVVRIHSAYLWRCVMREDLSPVPEVYNGRTAKEWYEAYCVEVMCQGFLAGTLGCEPNMDAMTEAVHDLREKAVGRWVDAGTRKPPAGEFVVGYGVSSHVNGKHDICVWSGTDWWSECGTEITGGVTHWMPIPPDPEDGDGR